MKISPCYKKERFRHKSVSSRSRNWTNKIRLPRNQTILIYTKLAWDKIQFSNVRIFTAIRATSLYIACLSKSCPFSRWWIDEGSPIHHPPRNAHPLQTLICNATQSHSDIWFFGGFRIFWAPTRVWFTTQEILYSQMCPIGVGRWIGYFIY